ncbi:granzyme A-like [Sphaerodactylus townsendi]|uniref:granzyme A-like n=1 Tax=Sphaerodactylus townsendi TaxID=933632 RepID=UPI002026710B|nr:granzyme A-like [Sphaerodactylus townsendi]
MDLRSTLSFSAAIIFLTVHRGHCTSIIGGKESAAHSRPYMAALMSGKHLICGGTLIQGNWVLTAAHCSIENGTTIILGAHSLSKNEPEKQIFEITRVCGHPKYNKKTKENDIMLLKLNRKAKMTRAVKIMKMPRSYDDMKAGTRCLVTGWGITENGGKGPDTLHEAEVTIISRDVCNDKNHYDDIAVKKSMVCAGGVKKKRTDTCKGDSGGPLICGGIQRGITSFGRRGKCADPKYPGVYTRLTKDYLEWIKKIMGENLD